MLVLFFFLIFIIGIILSKIEIKLNDLKINIEENDFFYLLDMLLKKQPKKVIMKILNEVVYLDAMLEIKCFFILKIFSINILKKDKKINIYLCFLKIKINITKQIKEIFNNSIKKINLIKNTTNFIKHLKEVNVIHSNTELKIYIGLANTFFTSIAIPILTNILIKVIINEKSNEIPKLNITPIYNEKINLHIKLKSDFKIRTINISKILYINLKERKNNKYKLKIN